MKKRIVEQLKVIKENTVDLISEEEITRKLQKAFKENRPLKLKIGFDPTSSDIHLGHTVLLKKLRKIQDLGHIVYFIVGDFTARIGDPSGRKNLRPVLTPKEIISNARTYTRQAFKILDKKGTKIIFNSRWYKTLSLIDFLPLLSRYTVARMLERDDFSQRMKEGRPLTILEFIYPLIQGYDSVMMRADIEFGGTDQKFNLIVGRHLQESFGQEPQGVVTMSLLVGLDGKKKMSKSLGNYIGITEKPSQMLGKVMSISDETMWEYFRILTDFDLEKIKKNHPKEAKLILAREIVAAYYSSEIADKERREFERVFSKRKIPLELPVYTASRASVDLIEVLYKTKLVSTRNEARRLIQQKGIKDVGKEGFTIEDRMISIPPGGVILKIGKRKFLKIIYRTD